VDFTPLVPEIRHFSNERQVAALVEFEC